MTLCTDCGHELPEAGGSTCDDVLALLAGPKPDFDPAPGRMVFRVGASWLTGLYDAVAGTLELNAPCQTLRQREAHQRQAALPQPSREVVEHGHAEQLRKVADQNPASEIVDFGPGNGFLVIPPGSPGADA